MIQFKPSDYDDVLDAVTAWPSETKRMFVRDLVDTVSSREAEPIRLGPRVEDMIGLGSGDEAPPDDATVLRWVEEHRSDQYK